MSALWKELVQVTNRVSTLEELASWSLVGLDFKLLSPEQRQLLAYLSEQGSKDAPGGPSLELRNGFVVAVKRTYPAVEEALGNAVSPKPPQRVLMIDDVKLPAWIFNPETGNMYDESVVVARSAEGGIGQLAMDARWDVLLLDHDLGPDGDGRDVMAWLEANVGSMPGKVYLITSNIVAGPRMLEVLHGWREQGLISDYGWLQGTNLNKWRKDAR